MISVIATIQTKPGKLDEFIAAFQALVPEVLAEEGCIEYFPATDIDSRIEAQSPVRPDCLTVLEKWESSATLAAHLAAPHMSAFREHTSQLVEDLTIHVVQPCR
jgi:quinol monooxygenase YgiN